MTSRFGRELRDQKRNGHSADHRHKNHQWSPRTCRREKVGIVTHCDFAQEQSVMDQANKIPKHDCAEAGHDPNNQGKDARDERD